MELASAESTKKRSCFPTAKILKEALVIISRNVKLFLAIAVLVFIPSSLLFLATQLAIKPQANQILTKITKSAASDYSRFLPHIIKSTLLLLSEELVLFVVSWSLSVFFMVSTIYASAVTYSGKNDLSLRELLASIRRPGKRAAVTCLYVTLFNIGFIIVYMLAFILMIISSTQGSSWGGVILKLLGVSMIILSLVLNVFLTAVWTLSVAVSVLEEGSSWYGMRALKKAWDLTRGRKLQAFRLSGLTTLAMLPVSAFLGWQAGNGSAGESLLVRVVRLVLQDGVSVLLQLLVYVAYTVFYYECKTSHGDHEKVNLEGKPHYSLIPASPSP